MAFYGKVYSSAGHENLDKWVRATVPNAPEERLAAMLSEKSNIKVVKNGDSYTITQGNDQGSRDTTFKSGVEFDDVMGQSGTPVKSTYNVSGNTITQVAVGPAGTTTFKREFNGDDLVLTITSDNSDVVAKRFYKA